MKKLIALSIFLFLITFTSLNFIKSYAFSNVTFDVISYFDNQNQTNNTIINAAYGSSLSFENNLGSMSNYVFEAWVINGVVEFAANINTTFPITNNMNVKALFSPSDHHLAVFIDSNSKYLGHDYVVHGGVAVASGFVEPTKPGYQVAAEKWNRPLHNITDDVMFVLQYEKTLLEYFHIAVFQGSGTGSYLFNSQVTVIANLAPSGQFFNNWTNSDGVVVSSNPTYTFTALNHQTLTANFSSIPPTEVPLISSQLISLRPGRHSYLSQVHVPSDHTIIEFGVITSTFEKLPSMSFSNADNYYKGLVLNTLTNEFLISLPKDHFFSRAYLITKDALDNVIESYSVLHVHPDIKLATSLTWENESKPSYASASVLIDGNNWNLDDSLIGSLTSDLKHDTKSLRIRNLGFLVSEFPFEAGISTLHFSYGLFGSDPNSAIAVEYAYEWDPNTWHRIPFSLGDELAVTNNNSLESITLNININASIFLRIIKTNSSGRVNLDNIIINNCSHMITFNSNGGSSVEPIIQDFATPVFSPNNPILSGFTFGGWFTDIALTNEFIFDFMPYGDIVLHAKWVPDNPYMGYYAGAGGLTGQSLKTFLRTTITAGFTGVTYGATRYILDDTDQDPNNPGNVILVYLGTSVSGAWDAGTTWNREHVWPQFLLGEPANNNIINISSDLHSLKPANPAENSSRGKKYFDDSGVSGSYNPRDEVKGDVARILFYKVVMYEHLELVNSVPNVHQMGKLDTLLQWHLFDPVDDFERNRNAIIFSHQNNRNPFIDHPEFVEMIWGAITLTNNNVRTLFANSVAIVICTRTYDIDYLLFKKNAASVVSSYQKVF